jgi:hypothetical protein
MSNFKKIVLPKKYEGLIISDCLQCPFFQDGVGGEYWAGCEVTGEEYVWNLGKPQILKNCPMPGTRTAPKTLEEEILETGFKTED